MNRVDYRRDSFIGTPPEVLRNKLPVLHCSAEELADVKECQHFRPVTPQEIANTAKAIGCATVWAATHGGNITSEEQVTILTFVLPELPTAEDVTDAGAAVIQVNEAAAMLAGALDGTKVLVPVESNGVVMFHNREVSTFCDRKVPIGELPYAHVPPKLAEAMGVFIREFFAKGIAKYVVQRGVVGYPWVVLDLAIDLPIGIPDYYSIVRQLRERLFLHTVKVTIRRPVSIKWNRHLRLIPLICITPYQFLLGSAVNKTRLIKS
jgi:hypothetical protein